LAAFIFKRPTLPLELFEHPSKEGLLMKKALAVLAVVLTLGLSAVTLDAQARRLGGGKSAGMQRQTTTLPAKPATGTGTAPATAGQAAPVAGSAAAAATAAAAAPKRSWIGPIAGIAAGLGLAALASHFGFGEALANMMTIGLLVMGVLLLIGFVMRKRAMAQGGMPQPAGVAPQGGGWQIGSAAAPGGTADVVPGFDTAAFAANAKSQFLALQAANDARDLGRLREYLTPEMFDAVRAEITERGDAPQRTEVFGLEAQVLAVAEEGSDYVASVRFTGSVREQHGAVPQDLDETWHLTKPRSGSGGWVIAGIQQGANASPAA
jgi:predicted lipid-binding transport protein (Tim44 family)